MLPWGFLSNQGTLHAVDRVTALDTVLFTEITAQFTAKAVRVTTGTLVDATVIGSASEA